jgi:hypothetical protein
MFKYIAILRSFPEVESVFYHLDDYIKKINIVGQQTEDGYSRITPSLRYASMLRIELVSMLWEAVNINILF